MFFHYFRRKEIEGKSGKNVDSIQSIFNVIPNGNYNNDSLGFYRLNAAADGRNLHFLPLRCFLARASNAFYLLAT